MLSRFADSIYLLLQRALPHHLLSRAAGMLADSHSPWLKNLLIRLAVRRYRIDLSEAIEPAGSEYASFNEFFTRALRPDARALAGDERTLVSPADGVISAAGKLRDNQILQAKHHRYAISALVGEDSPRTQALAGGSFVTIYLSPRDYHRVHAPLAGSLNAANYLPGRLFSVNPRTDRALPGLYPINERLVCWLDTASGEIALVMVGALLVAGIETVWHGRYQPGVPVTETFPAGPQFARGAEIGRFRFGSTVILLAPSGVDLRPMVAGDAVQMGQRLAVG